MSTDPETYVTVRKNLIYDLLDELARLRKRILRIELNWEEVTGERMEREAGERPDEKIA